MAFSTELRSDLVNLLGSEWVKDDPVTLYTYRCDGLTLYTAPPMGVVYPGNRDELVEVVKKLHTLKIPFVPRGAGTGLSGGAVPQQQSVIIEMARFKEIHDIDWINRTITIGPGVINLRISEKVQPDGYHYVPDPSSQKACTIGGNVAENSGGPHTLKYGVTVNHVLGLEMVLPDGEVVELGGKHFPILGPDMLALVIGSEGTFGIVTKITCRLTPNPEKAITLLGIFDSVHKACEGVSAIVRKGIIPAAMEMIDKVTIYAVEQALKPGFPTDAEAVLIIEVDGLIEGLEEEAQASEELLLQAGAREVKWARDDEERARIWRARKEAFGAIGQISPNYYVQDGVIPRSSLPEVLDKIAEVGKKFSLTVANVFHAGDGNLHPLIMYDANIAGQLEKAEEFGAEILKLCVQVGGVLTGEHGVGVEKRDLMGEMFSEDDMKQQQRVKCAFDPDGLLNPGKVYPTLHRCVELGRLHVSRGQLRFPDIPRF